MRAIILEQTGGAENLQYKEVPTPTPGERHVLLKIHACAVCYRDIVDRVGRFPFIQLPTVPGHEFAGEVVAVGPGVTTVAVGDRVINQLHRRCGTCRPCLSGRSMHCENAPDFFGVTAWGGYAEYAAVHELALLKVPASIPLTVASTLMCTAGMTLQALRRGNLQAGEKVLVTGASGGVGMAAIQIAKIMGATVVAVTGSAQKVKALEEAGADDVIVNGDGKFHYEVNKRHPGGVDLAYEAVGGPTFNASLRSVRGDGRVVLVGNITGENLTINPGLMVVKGLAIFGSDGANPQDVYDVFGFVERGLYKPHIQEELPLARAADAQRMLEARGVVGRLVLRP
jgi:D-arabinose 1-dehydrogenase-like Zn-dependent alcohol dehydrogenase